MKIDRALLLPSLFLVAISLACQQPAADPADHPATASPASQAPAKAKPPEEVTYEPAYPPDVNGEGLDAADVAQQETHSHGADTHTHDGSAHGQEDGHTHDEKPNGESGDEHEH